MWALDASNGAVLWESSRVRDFFVMRDRVVVVSSWDGAASLHSRADWKLVAEISLAEGTFATKDDALYALSDGRVLAIDPSGVVRRRSDLKLTNAWWASRSFPVHVLLAREHIEGLASVQDYLVAIDPIDLRERWRLSKSEVAETSQSIVFTNSDSGSCGSEPLVARDAASGAKLWSVPSWCGWTESVAADDSLAVTHRRGSQVTALDASTGKARWTTTVE